MTDRASYQRKLAEHNDREVAVRKLHWGTTVVLGYCCIPMSLSPDGRSCEASAVLGNDSLCATNLDRLILGGVRVIVWSPGIPNESPSGRSLTGRDQVDFYTMQFRAMHELEEQTDGLLRIARSVGEIREINDAGGVAVLLHLGGPHHQGDLGILREYYDLGLRMVHLRAPECAHQGKQADMDAELNDCGLRALEEIKRLGMVVDVAHTTVEGLDDLLPRMDGLPVVYSHGGCGALTANIRNFDDARIKAIAQGGGVYAIGAILGGRPGGQKALLSLTSDDEDPAQTIGERRTARAQRMDSESPTVSEFLYKRSTAWNHWEEREMARLKAVPVKSPMLAVVEHMKYVREHFGADAVGYGPDYERSYGNWQGLEEADKTPNLTRALLDEGFTPEDTQAAMGHNFMRVFERVIG